MIMWSACDQCINSRSKMIMWLSCDQKPKYREGSVMYWWRCMSVRRQQLAVVAVSTAEGLCLDQTICKSSYWSPSEHSLPLRIDRKEDDNLISSAMEKEFTSFCYTILSYCQLPYSTCISKQTLGSTLHLQSSYLVLVMEGCSSVRTRSPQSDTTLPCFQWKLCCCSSQTTAARLY